MTLELYYLEETDSICSNRVVVALREKGITDWKPHKMQLVERDQFRPAYLDLNTQGVVPTLVHDGRPIRESSLITDYLDDMNAGAKHPMKLVMFLDACEHVSRICRILRQPLGNGLLLGVGGSGRQSLTKLATYISNYKKFQIEVIKGY